MRTNFWFDNDGNCKYPGLVAVLRNVVLFDRRLLGAKNDPLLRDTTLRGNKTPTAKNWPWLVYNAADTRYYGEYLCHKTKKAAIADFISRAVNSPADTTLTAENPLPQFIINALGAKGYNLHGDYVAGICAPGICE